MIAATRRPILVHRTRLPNASGRIALPTRVCDMVSPHTIIEETSAMKRSAMIAIAIALLTFNEGPARADLVVDGGFEAATPGIITGSLGDGAWSATQGIIYVNADPTLANSGNNSVQLTAAGSLNVLTQTLTTQPGQNYLLSFYAASDTGTDTFAVLFGGQIVTTTPVPQTFPPLGTAHGTFVLESFMVTATSDSTNLSFQGQYGGQGAASYGTFVDDVSITAVVPEPSTITLSAVGALIAIPFIEV